MYLYPVGARHIYSYEDTRRHEYNSEDREPSLRTSYVVKLLEVDD